MQNARGKGWTLEIERRKYELYNDLVFGIPDNGYSGVYRLSAKAQSIWYGAPACDGVGYFDFGVYVDPFTDVRTSC